ncbi:hypothetical protein ACNR90_000024, partial (mitochondrion) [Candidozyma auris]
LDLMHVGVFGSIPAILFFGGGTDANMNRNIIINSNRTGAESAIGLSLLVNGTNYMRHDPNPATAKSAQLDEMRSSETTRFAEGDETI